MGSQWTTIDHDDYKVQVNGGDWGEGRVAYEVGNYHALLKNCPAYQEYGELSFEESHGLFKGALTTVFPWRHWGHLDGVYRENQGHGEKVEMFGVARATVTEDLKIQRIEVFYDPETFIKVMEGKYKPTETEAGKAILGDISCPYIAKGIKIRVEA